MSVRAPRRSQRLTRAERRRRPVRRRAALAGLALGLALAAGLVTFVGALRHPLPSAPPPGVPAEPEADPREEATCGAPSSTVADAGAEPPLVRSNVLYDCPDDFDGVVVRYEGEVVGALLERRGSTWSQLNDDVYAGDLGPLPAHRDFRGGNAGVGVLLPPGTTERITFVGGPAARGDVIEVTGTFERVDAATGEVAVIRADEARVLRSGEPLEDAPLRDRQVAAYVAVALAVGLTVTERLVRRRD